MRVTRLLHFFCITLSLSALQSCFVIRQIFAPAPSSEPLSAHFVTSDIDNFWKSYDAAREAIQKGDTQAVIKTFDNSYFSKASVGLQDFEELRFGSREKYCKLVMRMTKYYDTIRTESLKIRDLDSVLRQLLFVLKKLYPEAVFPDIYFVVGMLTSGGTLSNTGLIIGTEFYSLPKNFDRNIFFKNPWYRLVTQPIDKLKYIIAHELIHSQQPSLRFSATRPRTLLEQSIQEGGADFVCELIAGATINDHVREFAEPHERELWKEFTLTMNSSDYSRWLYNGSNSTDRPADLGYWIGYRICKIYYEHTTNKHEALRTILTINDAAEFLKISGYAETIAK